MKLLESMNELDDDINKAIQKMIKELFDTELDDEVIDDMVENLTLSDLLVLDRAYTNQDRATIRDIIGPMPQMEYSMGMGRKAISHASTRPKTQGQDQPEKEPPSKNNTGVQVNRTYSGSGGQDNSNVDNSHDDNESDDQNLEEHQVVSMREWLQRRAGIE